MQFETVVILEDVCGF